MRTTQGQPSSAPHIRDPLLLSVPKAAKSCGYGVAKFKSWAEQKNVPFIEDGTRRKYRPQDLDAYVAAQLVSPKDIASHALNRSRRTVHPWAKPSIREFLNALGRPAP